MTGKFLGRTGEQGRAGINRGVKRSAGFYESFDVFAVVSILGLVNLDAAFEYSFEDTALTILLLE